MSSNKNTQDDTGSSRIIESYIRKAVEEGELNPDELDHGPNQVFWDRTTIRTALVGLFVLVSINLFFYYNMRLDQVDNTSDWVPERRGFLVEYREEQGRIAYSSAESAREADGSESAREADGADAGMSSTDPQNPASTDEPGVNEQQAEVSADRVSATSQSEISGVPVQISENNEIDPASLTESGDGSDSARLADQPGVIIENLLESWAQSWSMKNVENYLDHYSTGFVSQGGAPYEPWAELRRERVEAPSWIRVSIRELRVSVNADSAVAEFVQVYTSSDFSSDSRKTLVFQLEGEDWKIVRETVIPSQ